MEAPVRSMYMDIVERKTLGKNLYRVTIAANEKVRQPPELDFDGISTDNYARNPVVMWAHDAVGSSPSGGLPISDGRSVSTRPPRAGLSPTSSSLVKTLSLNGLRMPGTRGF